MSRNQTSKPSEQILVRSAAERVLELLREQDAVIGHLTDHHIKCLLMFTYHWFSVRNATVTIDFHSRPRKIFISPHKMKGEKLESFSALEWKRYQFKLKWHKVESRLPGKFAPNGFQIQFCRLPVQGSYVIGPKDEHNLGTEITTQSSPGFEPGGY